MVLIVEDDPRVRRVLRSALELEGFSAQEAATKEEALDLFNKAQFDLVTLDLTLGQTDGLQLAREMRAIRNVPLVMITGKGSEIDRIAGLEYGADEYIVKPFNLREVCSVGRLDSAADRLAMSFLTSTTPGTRRRRFLVSPFDDSLQDHGAVVRFRDDLVGRNRERPVKRVTTSARTSAISRRLRLSLYSEELVVDSALLACRPS